MITLNPTNDPSLRSWLESANATGCPFPVQNLPYGVFSTAANPTPRVGVAIGDQVLDLAALDAAGLVGATGGAAVFATPSVNAFMALGPTVWSGTRARLSSLLADGGDAALRDNKALRRSVLVPMASATMHLPLFVRSFTDFYASREHATNVGTMFRDPQNALMPNRLHLPIGYNGRASTVVVSGTDVRRPLGQIKSPSSSTPSFGACQKLDIELELGAIVGTCRRQRAVSCR